MAVSSPLCFSVATSSSTYIVTSSISASMPSVVTSTSRWALGVLGVAITGVRSICIGGERYIDLRVVVAVGVAG